MTDVQTCPRRMAEFGPCSRSCGRAGTVREECFITALTSCVLEGNQ